MEFHHIPVLSTECIEALKINPDGIYADGTVGGAGHSYLIEQKLKSGRLLAIDRDSVAIEAAKRRLSEFSNVTYVNSNFCHIKQITEDLEIEGIDGALLDLGVSSYQIDTPERGFTYREDAPLDMRMDMRRGFSAYDVVNEYSCEKLADIIYGYSEERWAKRIAEFIAEERKKEPIKTTSQLVSVIKKAIPQGARKEGGHPAKRTFQAIRIEVNGELDILKQAIKDFVFCLKPGGRLCIITFHSLEDRIVKQTYAELAKGCTCPADFPVCVCGKKPLGKIITRKPVTASEAELKENLRAHSAKLRVFEKI